MSRGEWEDFGTKLGTLEQNIGELSKKLPPAKTASEHASPRGGGTTTSIREVRQEKRHISKIGGKWYFSMRQRREESFDHLGARAWQRFKKKKILIPLDCAEEIVRSFHLA